MADFFNTLLHPLPNAVMTVIVAILFIYWLFVFLFGIGVDDLDLGFDFDVDVEAEADVDVDVDADGEVDSAEPSAEKSPGFFMKFLDFMNVGKVPFMLVFSMFKFFIWVGSLITTQLVDVSKWGLLSLLILIPLAFIAVFFTKFATRPFVKFFKQIGYKGEEEIDFLGRSGKMVSNIKDKKIGVAEFIVDKNPIKLNVVSNSGEELKYGDYVIVADESDDKKVYFVNKEISIRNL